LEVGCGTGFFTIPAAELMGDEGHVYAIDPHPLSIEQVAKKIRDAGLTNVRLIKADAIETGLASDCIDLVLLFGVIPSPTLPLDRLLPEMYRLLKPEGALAVWTAFPWWLPASLTRGGLFAYVGKGRGVYNFRKEVSFRGDNRTMVTERPENKSKLLSLLRGLKNLLGVGRHLLLLGLLLEGLTIVIQQWISFPIPLTFEMRILLTIPCVAACLLGMIWFNRSLNLIKVNLLNGKNELVTHGPFTYVRHPLYSTIMITIPPLVIIWFSDLLFFIPWVLMFIVSHYVVSLEERGLIEVFGKDYEKYQGYVPALLPYKGAGGQRYREHCDDSGLKLFE